MVCYLNYNVSVNLSIKNIGCPGNCLGECPGEMSRGNMLEPSGTNSTLSVRQMQIGAGLTRKSAKHSPCNASTELLYLKELRPTVSNFVHICVQLF